jgi:hypothetical protein
MSTLYTSIHHQISCAPLQYFKRRLHSIAPLGLPGTRALSSGQLYGNVFYAGNNIAMGAPPTSDCDYFFIFYCITFRPKASGYKPSLFLHHNPFISPSSYCPVSPPSYLLQCPDLHNSAFSAKPVCW